MARSIAVVPESAIPSEAIHEQLNKILASRMLVQSKRLARFLSFIVEKAIAGEGDQVNEYMIGVEVYQRPASFDPRIDTIVRTEARRLRSKLGQYYDTEGGNDPILIEVPRGAYAPVFRERERGILEKNIGQLVSHYWLLEKLGEGGMGTIYLAEDTRLGRKVALKFIASARLKEKDAKTRLIGEARAAAAIDHPNVASVYEIGEVEGQPFIAMAYVKGQNLEDRIAEGQLEIREALHIGCQLADGLEAAHRKGVIHRDLNPSNVILSDDGWVRIIDFGIAQLTATKRLTEPGTSIGTAQYVSPEQIKGEAVDQRTDIWSLGVILYELFTGRRPFEADHREAVYYAITHKTPEPMNRWRPGIPEELERLVLKCLEKEPARRYSDAATLKADLLGTQSEVLRTGGKSASHAPSPGESVQMSDLMSDSTFRSKPLAPGQGDDGPKSGEGATTRQGDFSATEKEKPSSSGTRPGVQLRFPGRRLGWILGATFAGLLAVAGWVRWSRPAQQQQPRQVSTSTTASIPRLAVLPLESRTPGEENQAIAFAISDSLITHLSRLPGVAVTSWTSVLRLTERKSTLAEIARILNAGYVLEGSFLRSGQNCRVTVQLIRTSDDIHVWADTFDLPWKDIFAAQQKVSEGVARQIQLKLGPEETQLLARNSTQNVDAYQAYARGRYSLVRFSNFRDPKYINEAEKYLKRALEEEPNYADALADLGYLCYLRFYPPQGDRKELAAQGIANSQRALAIDPGNVEAHYVLGSLYDHIGQGDKALELCREAVALGPNNPEAHHHLAWRYLERGFYESGIKENNIAIAKDSLFMDPYLYNMMFLARLGKYEDALATANQLEELEPTSPFPDLYRADVAFCQGDFSRAEAGWLQASAKPSIRLQTSRIFPILLATISAKKGQIEEARQVLQNSGISLKRSVDYPIKLAALVGEKKLALDLIQNSPLFNNYRWLINDPDIASLRNDPQFRELLFELYHKWQHDLAAVGPSLPLAPPTLPTPEEYLSRRAP